MPPKVVVFDLDETLGYFFQLGQLWDLMHFYIEKNKKSMYVKLTQTEFTELLNLFPEYLRPNIFSILKYLKHKK
jgi:phosphoserine phosphatase